MKIWLTALVSFSVLSSASFVHADRLFATSNSNGLGLIEIDPMTGVVRSVLESPPRAVWDGLAFDGLYLWHLGLDANTLFKLDATTGETLDSFSLPETGFRAGLAHLDGLIYILDWSVLQQDISVFDPTVGAIVDVLDFDGVNQDAPLLGNAGLAAISGPNALLVNTAFTGEVIALDPTTGMITHRFDHDRTGGELGLAAVGGQIYLGANTSADIFVYDRQGEQVGTITVPGSIGIQSLAGDDTARIPEPSTLCLLLVAAVVALGHARWRSGRTSP